MNKTSVTIEGNQWSQHEGIQWSQYFISTDTCINKIFKKIIAEKNNRLIKRIILEIEK